MNPLKYRLPQQQQNDTNELHPRPNALAAWIAAQPIINLQSTAPLMLKVLQAYNRCTMPAAVRFKAMLTLQPVVDKLVKLSRDYYQNESLPLQKNARAQAALTAQFLEETAFAYKTVVADSVLDTESNEMSINLFIAALRLTIDHLGHQLLECYAQYAPPVPGLWGEIHRTYQLAERNGLHTRVLAENMHADNPFATVQHGYLRLALLALARPNHLMPGQAVLIYDYLETWTVGCRIISKKITVAETGDIVIDLDSERPPAIATGYARFRPVDGRFLDISALQEKLDEVSASINPDAAAKDAVPLTITERLRRDLLSRLRKAWQGRAERADQRESDMASHVRLCLGLEACHFFISGGQNFAPEQDEIRYHRPQETSDGLALIPTQDVWPVGKPTSTDHAGQDTTRLSRFGERVDVWDAIHETEIHARSKREAAMAHFREEPWLCLNESAGGLALRRLPDNQSRTRVGAVVAFHDGREEDDLEIAQQGDGDDNKVSNKPWKVGALIWLQNDPDHYFDLGIQTLADSASAVAVRAIGGAGTGGEYFRSLLIHPCVDFHTVTQTTPQATAQADPVTRALLVPASIYDIGTQLVLNRQTTLEYVRLTQLLETTSAFSLFAFKHIETPPAEQARINGLNQPQSQ